MSAPPAFPADAFAQAGLNRHHLFSLAALPATMRAALNAAPNEKQLILLGHGGRKLWSKLQAARPDSDDPIDDYTRLTVDRVLGQILPPSAYRIVYPGTGPIGLQALGALAGWHHPSPFAIGMDAEWGSWFAYRAVILANSDFALSPTVDRGNPCLNCQDRPCLSACPAGACGTPFALDACMDERLLANSPCRHNCLARRACPVGREHAYDAAQMAHSYARSLAMIAEWRQAMGRTPDKATQPRNTR